MIVQSIPEPVDSIPKSKEVTMDGSMVGGQTADRRMFTVKNPAEIN